MTTTSSLKVQPIIRVMLSAQQFLGSSGMTCNIVMRQQMGGAIAGTSDLANNALTLVLRIPSIKFTGAGILTPTLNVATPFKGSLSGFGESKINDKMYLLQQLNSHISAGGIFNTQFIMQSPISTHLAGDSTLTGIVALPLPMPMDFIGSGDIILRRLSAVNENILELININLLPGETVTIDTDLLQVLFGSMEDVSAVTNDSVFFELNPGENEILISTDSGTTLDVTAVWQNRWL